MRIKLKESDELVNKHWSYVEQTLKMHGEDEDIIRIVGFHYKTAMLHGYKHGIEAKYGKSV